jgi:hypothetical protein
MAGERKYTRIPPESTGDRVYMIHTAEIRYDNKDLTHVWQVGTRYNLTAAVFDSNNDFSIHVHGVKEETTTTGVLSVHYAEMAKHNGYSPEDNQEIRIGGIDGQIVGYVNGTAQDLYVPAQNIMGYDNPEYGWNIDKFGSGQITFQEGAPELSQYGELRTSNKQLIAQYVFNKGPLFDQFSNSLDNGGTIEWKGGYQAVEVKVQAVTGSKATHTSNLYHPYIPGANQLLIMATRMGDTGVDGCVRRWGMFDANDGYFFQLGTNEGDGSAVSLVHRRTFEGVKTENIIPQAMWNKDNLTGTGGGTNPSGMKLNINKTNQYWIDFQHLGGGSIRYGVYYQGVRLVIHEMDMGNGGGSGTWIHNAAGNPNLPICWATNVTDGTLATGEKSIFAYGAGVWSEGTGNTNALEEGNFRSLDESFQITPESVYGSTHYLFSMRPLRQLDGIANHSLYLPKFLTVDAYDANGDDIRGEIRIFRKCILRGVEWSRVSYATTEVDTEGYHAGHGPEMFRRPVKGIAELDFSNIFNTLQYGTERVNSEAESSIRSQDLLSINGEDNPYGTGQCVTLKVGTNPILVDSIHFFDDKESIEVSGVTEPSLTFLNGNTYITSLQDRDEMQIYSSIELLEDDRATRELSVNYTGEHHGHENDHITFKSGAAINERVRILELGNRGTSTDYFLVGDRQSTTIDSVVAGDTFCIERIRSIDTIVAAGGTASVRGWAHHFETNDKIKISGTTSFNTASVDNAVVTNGSTSITGAGFTATGLNPGDFIEVDERHGQISTISDTEIILVAPYPGPTGTHTLYEVVQITVVDEHNFTYATDVVASQETTGTATSYHHHAFSLDVFTTEVNSYPLDYKTVLNAVKGSGSQSTGAMITGNPPAQSAWTFMWNPVKRPVEDEVQNIRISLAWKERIQ